MVVVTAPKDRAVHLSSTGGSAVYLEAGETLALPDFFAVLAVAAGCAVVPQGAKQPVQEPTQEEVSSRDEKIADAVRVIIDGGKKEHFTLQGKPRTAAVEEILGFDVSAQEVADAYEALINDDRS